MGPTVPGRAARLSLAAAAAVWAVALWAAAGSAPAGAGAAATPCAPILISNSGTTLVPASVLQFAAGASGDVAPAAIVGGPRNSRLVTASGLAVDSAGYLYVAAPHINALLVYAPGATGDAAPYAVLSGPNTGFNNPQGIVVKDNLLYVANGPFGLGGGNASIAVFSLPLEPGTRDLAPIAVLGGPATGLVSPFGIAVDAAGNIYVANLNNTVTEYAPLTASSYTAPDNVAPIRTFTTGLIGPEGLAISGSTLYVSNDNNTITEYSLVTGALTGTISGPATQLAAPLGVAVDAAGNLYVVLTADRVLEFAPGATGNATPTAVITGPKTTLNSPQFVFIAPCNGGGSTTTLPATTTTTTLVATTTTVPATTTTTVPATTTTTVPATTTTTVPATTTTTTRPATTTTTVPATTTTTTRPATTTTTVPATTTTTVPATTTTTTRPAATTTSVLATTTTVPGVTSTTFSTTSTSTVPPAGVNCRGMQATIVGTPGDDNLTGTSGNDVIVGLGGNDYILGLGGDDTICGSGGDDRLVGGSGADFIVGGDGADYIAGDDGDDMLVGKAGDDRIRGGAGNDKLDGKEGFDDCRGGLGADSVSNCEV